MPGYGTKCDCGQGLHTTPGWNVDVHQAGAKRFGPHGLKPALMDTKLMLHCGTCHARWEARGNAGKVWEGIGLPAGLKPCGGSPWHGYRFAKGKMHKPCTRCPRFGIIVTKLESGGYDRKECPACNGTGYGEVVE